jgi:hypothetical protein
MRTLTGETAEELVDEILANPVRRSAGGSLVHAGRRRRRRKPCSPLASAFAGSTGAIRSRGGSSGMTSWPSACPAICTTRAAPRSSTCGRARSESDDGRTDHARENPPGEGPVPAVRLLWPHMCAAVEAIKIPRPREVTGPAGDSGVSLGENGGVTGESRRFVPES